jgi:hypothetical protein
VPGLAVTILAAGLSFNIPEDKSGAHTGVISFWFFLFIIIYSVGAAARPVGYDH